MVLAAVNSESRRVRGVWVFEACALAGAGDERCGRRCRIAQRVAGGALFGGLAPLGFAGGGGASACPAVWQRGQEAALPRARVVAAHQGCGWRRLGRGLRLVGIDDRGIDEVHRLIEVRFVARLHARRLVLAQAEFAVVAFHSGFAIQQAAAAGAHVARAKSHGRPPPCEGRRAAVVWASFARRGSGPCSAFPSSSPVCKRPAVGSPCFA
mmetsp:Transcript_83739/g.186961  ORF Transcript_83739/g.186961 Transcript_83739/m.186961 type:complete len:210 (+) Transcript_83739:1102-1731(+)